VACLIPFLGGFVLPVAVLVSHSFDAEQWVEPGLARALLHSLAWAAAAVLLRGRWGVVMVYGARLSGAGCPCSSCP
jgi:iron(III) transport system permease protein